MYVFIYIYMHVRVCEIVYACICIKLYIYTYIYIHISLCAYIYIYICVCVCGVCVESEAWSLALGPRGFAGASRDISFQGHQSCKKDPSVFLAVTCRGGGGLGFRV